MQIKHSQVRYDTYYIVKTSKYDNGMQIEIKNGNTLLERLLYRYTKLEKNSRKAVDNADEGYTYIDR